MPYKILEMEKLPDSLKNKPRWVSCLVFTAVFLAVTASAVCIGAVIGYMYCYFEHHTGIRPVTQNTTNLHIVRIPYPDSEEARYNRTLHGALMSNAFVSKMLKITRVIAGDNSADCTHPHLEDAGVRNITK